MAQAFAEADRDLDQLHALYLHGGQLLHAQGHHQLALTSFQQALEYATASHSAQARARCRYNLAVVSIDLDLRDEARRHLDAAALLGEALAWTSFTALLAELRARIDP